MSLKLLNADPTTISTFTGHQLAREQHEISLHDAQLHKAGGMSSVVAIKTPVGGRSDYMVPASTTFPVAVELAVYNLYVYYDIIIWEGTEKVWD